MRNSNMNAGNFGPNLQTILDAMGITQVQFAKYMGWQTSYVNSIIKGRTTPVLANVIEILQKLPVTFERMVSDTNAQMQSTQAEEDDGLVEYEAELDAEFGARQPSPPPFKTQVIRRSASAG